MYHMLQRKYHACTSVHLNDALGFKLNDALGFKLSDALGSEFLLTFETCLDITN